MRVTRAQERPAHVLRQDRHGVIDLNVEMVHHGGDRFFLRREWFTTLAAQGRADAPGACSFSSQDSFDGNLVSPFVSSKRTTASVLEHDSY